MRVVTLMPLDYGRRCLSLIRSYNSGVVPLFRGGCVWGSRTGYKLQYISFYDFPVVSKEKAPHGQVTVRSHCCTLPFRTSLSHQHRIASRLQLPGLLGSYWDILTYAFHPGRGGGIEKGTCC
jgi:hypothetical protein